jgi:hypothetical protein
MYLDEMKKKHLTSAAGEWTVPTNAVIRAIRARNGSASFKARNYGSKGDDFADNGVYATGAAMDLEYGAYEYGQYDKITVTAGTVTVFYTNTSQSLGE